MPICNTQGAITGAVILARDVTESCMQEQRSHQVLNALLHMAQVAVQPMDSVPMEIEEHSPSSRQVAGRLAELTRQVLGCHRLGLTYVEPQTRQLHPLVVIGLSPQQEQQWWSEQLQQDSSLDTALSQEQNE
jgi:hypothetical protein